jgi:hypothetical protein
VVDNSTEILSGKTKSPRWIDIAEGCSSKQVWWRGDGAALFLLAMQRRGDSSPTAVGRFCCTCSCRPGYGSGISDFLFLSAVGVVPMTDHHEPWDGASINLLHDIWSEHYEGRV